MKDWDANNQCALKSAPGAADINRTIDEWKAIMNEVFARYELLEKRVPTLGEIKDLFNDMVGRKTKTNESLADPNMDLFHVFDLFTDMMGKQNQWTPSTFEKFAAIKHHLYDFDPHLSFPGINESKMQAYLAYLERKNCETPPSPRILLCTLVLAVGAQKGFYNGDVQDTFKPKLKGTDGNSKEIIYLTQDEIKTLENHVFLPTQAALERVRDIFLFCCFTGLRYSDVAKLKGQTSRMDLLRLSQKRRWTDCALN